MKVISTPFSLLVLTSWVFSMFFFLPLCAIIGPVGKCGSIPFARIGECLKRCLSFGYRRANSDAVDSG